MNALFANLNDMRRRFVHPFHLQVRQGYCTRKRSAEMSEIPMMKRCDWAFASQLYIDYNDKEWGVPVHDERKLFEMLTLEGVQAGLSWSLILKKRAGYLKALDGFDANKIARYDERKVQELLANPESVRKSLQEVPASTRESDAMSKELKRRGFTFVGTTICYAFMQAVGMVNDHIVDCFRWQEVQALATHAD